MNDASTLRTPPSQRKKHRRGWLPPQRRPATPCNRPAECRDREPLLRSMKALVMGADKQRREVTEEELALATGRTFHLVDYFGVPAAFLRSMARFVLEAWEEFREKQRRQEAVAAAKAKALVAVLQKGSL